MFWYTQLLNTSFVLLVFWQHLFFTVFETRRLSRQRLQSCVPCLPLQPHPLSNSTPQETQLMPEPGDEDRHKHQHICALPMSSLNWCCMVQPGSWVEGGPLEHLSPVSQGPDNCIKDTRIPILLLSALLRQQGTSCLLSFCLLVSVPCNHKQQLSTNREFF